MCIPLHHLLAAAFPAQYTARAAESAALEAVQAVQSVEVVPLSAREQQLLGAALHAPAHTVGTCRPQQQQQQACEAGPSRSNDTGHGSSSSSSSRVAEAQAAPAAGAAGAAVQAGSGAVTDAAVAVAAGGDGMLAAAAAAQGDAVFEDAAPGVPALLRCAVAGCGRLLHEPLTLNCGCVVCSSCALTPPPPPVVATSTASATGTSLSPVECVPAAAGAAVQAAQRDAAASEEAGAEAGGSCHSTQSQHSLPGVSEAQASVAASSSSSVGVSSFHCPCCHSSTGPRPRPCYKVGHMPGGHSSGSCDDVGGALARDMQAGSCMRVYVCLI